MSPRKHFDYEERLSAAAQEAGRNLFRQGKSYAQIASGIQARYQEKISVSAVQRYFSRVVVPAQRQFERVEQSYRALLNALREGDESDDARVARALLFQALLENEGPMAGTPADKLIEELRRVNERQLQRVKLERAAEPTVGSPREVYLQAAQDVLKKLRTRKAVRAVLDPHQEELVAELSHAAEAFEKQVKA